MRHLKILMLIILPVIFGLIFWAVARHANRMGP